MCRGVDPNIVRASTLAPASVAATEGFLLFPATMCRGVHLRLSRALTLAPASARQRVTSDAAAFSKNAAAFLAGRPRRGCRSKPPDNAGSRRNFRHRFLFPGTKLQPVKEVSAAPGCFAREFKPTASRDRRPAGQAISSRRRGGACDDSPRRIGDGAGRIRTAAASPRGGGPRQPRARPPTRSWATGSTFSGISLRSTFTSLADSA